VRGFVRLVWIWTTGKCVRKHCESKKCWIWKPSHRIGRSARRANQNYLHPYVQLQLYLSICIFWGPQYADQAAQLAIQKKTMKCVSVKTQGR